jgi:hypothetical protein
VGDAPFSELAAYPHDAFAHAYQPAVVDLGECQLGQVAQQVDDPDGRLALQVSGELVAERAVQVQPAVRGGREVGEVDGSGRVLGGVRFAFYGRMSTSEFQDPQTSRAWQRAVSDELVEGVGEVVVEFFDEGRSRRWS